MPALLLRLVNALGLTFAGLGALGVVLAGSQLLTWLFGAARPMLAPVWQHAGLTGSLLRAFFDWLPLILIAAAAFHGYVAWLGLALYRGRTWARRGALVFASAWAGFGAASWLLVRFALSDFATSDPARTSFALAAGALANQVAGLNLLLAALLALLLHQPAVRARFSAGTSGTSTSSAGRARAA